MEYATVESRRLAPFTFICLRKNKNDEVCGMEKSDTSRAKGCVLVCNCGLLPKKARTPSKTLKRTEKLTSLTSRHSRTKRILAGPFGQKRW